MFYECASVINGLIQFNCNVITDTWINTQEVYFLNYFFNDLHPVIPSIITCSSAQLYIAMQWLSGRVLHWRPRGRGFEPHRRHCGVVLEQDTFILA